MLLSSARLVMALAMAGTATAQSRSAVTSWSFGLDLSAMSAPSPATRGAIVAQCRLLTERKAGEAGAAAISPEAQREMQEDCMRSYANRR